MKLAFVIYDGMTTLDFVGVYDPVTRLRSMGFLPDLEWELCAFSTPVRDSQGLLLTPNRVNETLSGYDFVVIPGGTGSRSLSLSEPFLEWLKTASQAPSLASVCTGSLLLAAAGFLNGKHAATHPNARRELAEWGVSVSEARLVEDGNIITSSGVSAGIDLGLYLCQKLAGSQAAEKIKRQMDYPWPLSTPAHPANEIESAPRVARIERSTAETHVEVILALDGQGQHHIETGLPFLDHMLVQLAVHGLFDLDLYASGDLEVDPHHTVEDVAITLGQAFRVALGNRAGLVRMGSAEIPMDESLAWVAIDFSGRPYCVFQGTWHSPEVGGIPGSLYQHFFESFAVSARCNLHAQVRYGNDDHHQAEALFKALGRVLCSASRIDPRRSGLIPSSKGVIA